MSYVVAMFVHRPYVMALVLTFIVVAIAERGVLRMLLWLVTGTFLGWLAEFCSTRTGFPFTFYEYYPSRFPNEAWLSNIPLFASLSFAALTYFGHSLTYTLFSPLRHGRHGIERVEKVQRMLSLKVAVSASLLVTWSDFVIDPITHLGEYWFLGKLYRYVPGDYGLIGIVYRHLTPTWHFDIPVGNYLGWLITCFTIVYTNQAIDGALIRRGVPHRPGFDLPHRCLWSLGYFVGNLLFMLSIAITLLRRPDLPADSRIGFIVVNTVLFLLAFVTITAAVIRWQLRRSPATRPATP